MAKDFSIIIIGNPAVSELFEIGRVVQRAVGANYTDADLYTRGVSEESFDIIRRQLLSLKSVYSLSDDGDCSIGTDGNILSMITTIDKTDMFSYDKLLAGFSTGEFLLIVTDDIAKVNDQFTNDLVASYTSTKRNIYIIDANGSQWYIAPSYHGALLKMHNDASKIKQQTIIGQGIPAGDGITNKTSGMFAKTIQSRGVL